MQLALRFQKARGGGGRKKMKEKKTVYHFANDLGEKSKLSKSSAYV